MQWIEIDKRGNQGLLVPGFGWLTVLPSADKTNRGWISVVFGKRVPDMVPDIRTAKIRAIGRAMQDMEKALRALAADPYSTCEIYITTRPKRDVPG